jgi:4-diphosphocytidyl-2-C-methyl-D-erythritol kinase
MKKRRTPPRRTGRLPKLRSARVRAYAKVNLDLRVLGTRADGYHELRTVYQSIDLHDTITCSARRGRFTITCRTPGVPLSDDNLVWRAAAALWKALGFGGEVRDVVIRLDKGIPMQAGLGGGSSDAAATLVALGRLWAGRPPIAKLRDLAATLGADVSFFLSGGTALGLGSGEQIYPLVDLPPHWVVLVIPPFGVSTSEAYAWYDEERSGGYRETRELQVLPVPWPSRAARMTNDLEAPVARRHPEILETRDERRAAGSGRDRGGDVGQRVGRVRPLPRSPRRLTRAPAPHARRLDRASDANPQSRRVRIEDPADRAAKVARGRAAQ